MNKFIEKSIDRKEIVHEFMSANFVTVACTPLQIAIHLIQTQISIHTKRHATRTSIFHFAVLKRKVN